MLRVPTTEKTTLRGQSAALVRDHARLQQASKAALDYLFVAPTLVFLLPLFVIIALLIKLESPGPVLHKRRVIGQRGRFFEAYNFRTSYLDGEARLINNRQRWVAILNDEPHVTDPRVTRVGAALRRLGLEDLPRLFNILNRQMSLVGPHLLNQDDIARLGVNQVKALTSVKPGMTGLWQVRAYRTSVTERQALEMDYISNWSVRMDIQILLETFTAVREGTIQ